MGSFWGPMGLRFRPDGVLGGHLGSQGGQGASNLVRGSPKGAPRDAKVSQKVTNSSSEIGKGMVWEQKREKCTSKWTFFVFFIDSWSEIYEILSTCTTHRNQMPPVKRSKKLVI